MKGNIMALIDELEKATDEEIVSAGNKMARLLTNKILIGVVASVIVHFASDFICTALDNRKKTDEITE